MLIRKSDGAGEQRYRHLFENLPICIFVADLTVNPAVILEVNRRAELLYGYLAANLVGNPAIQLVPEKSRAGFQKVLQRVQQGETVTTESTHQRRDGSDFPVRVIAALDPTNPARMIATVEDITAEKQRRSEADAIDAERLRIAHEIHDGGAKPGCATLQGGAVVSSGRRGPRCHARCARRIASRAGCGRGRPAPRDLRLAPGGPRRTRPFSGTDTGGGLWRPKPIGRAAGGVRDAGIPAPSYELPLFRIIQQGLHNIARHALASSVLVRVTVDPAGGVALSLVDNGRGFDLSLVGTSGHFGLRHMRERILHAAVWISAARSARARNCHHVAAGGARGQRCHSVEF